MQETEQQEITKREVLILAGVLAAFSMGIGLWLNWPVRRVALLMLALVLFYAVFAALDWFWKCYKIRKEERKSLVYMDSPRGQQWQALWEESFRLDERIRVAHRCELLKRSAKMDWRAGRRGSVRQKAKRRAI